MAVSSLDEDRLAVHKKLASLNAYISESDFDRCRLSPAVLVV